MHAYLRFLYNFFAFGIIFAGISSFQGGIFNPVQTLSINSLFYILGIVIYGLFVCEAVYKTYRNPNVYIWRLRIVIKATLLSLGHFSPIYLLSSAVVMDILMLSI